MAIQEISVDELQGLLPNIVLIDVREMDEYIQHLIDTFEPS